MSVATSPTWWGFHQLDPRWAQRLVADADISPGAVVLDVGAGTGAITDPLVRRGARVVAIEVHPGRARLLRQRFGSAIVVVQADAADLRLPRHPYDVVANPPFGITTGLGWFVIRAWRTQGIRPGIVGASHHMGR